MVISPGQGIGLIADPITDDRPRLQAGISGLPVDLVVWEERRRYAALETMDRHSGGAGPHNVIRACHALCTARSAGVLEARPLFPVAFSALYTIRASSLLLLDGC